MKYVLIFIAVFLILILVALAELSTQNGRYQAYWNKRNLQQPAKNEILYIALGDSTAQGIGASQPERGYVGIISEELAQKNGKKVRTLNFSKTGARIDDVLNRQLALLQQANINDQTVVTIEIGANDMSSFEAGKFEKQMDELMSKLPGQTIISDIPYFGGGLHKRLEPDVKQANEIMYSLAPKYNFKLVPLHAKISENDDSLRNYAADRFHPSNNAYKTQWAPVFLEQIK